MIISQEKRQKNIAEYIIYMWQTEDLIRGFNLDIEKISKAIIEQYNLDAPKKEEIRQWYSDLIEMMNMENIQEKGHLQMLTNIVNDMNILHITLLSMPKEVSYHNLYKQVRPHIDALESKMPGEKNNKIESSLKGFYGILLLKLQNKELSEETKASIKEIARLLATLSKKYIHWEENPDDFTV